MKRIVSTCLLILAMTTVSNAFSWVDGRGQRCDIACEGRGLQAVTGGRHRGERFFVCGAHGSSDGRPGYNLAPEWSNKCFVAIGGREVGAPLYSCLCRAATDTVDWFSGDGNSCDVVCAAKGKSGIPKGSLRSRPFYVCKVSGRPGYNLQPKWSNACFIPKGGREVRGGSYSCACK
jgi:hypothetical protein